MIARPLLLLGVLFFSGAASAITLGDALTAESLLKTVDAMKPAERTEFIKQHRPELNQALMIRQSIALIGHTVTITGRTAERLYRQPIICDGSTTPQEDDSDDDAAGPRLPPDLAMPDLSVMAKDFKAGIRKAMKWPDSPEVDRKLNAVDVADVVVNRLIEEKKCPR